MRTLDRLEVTRDGNRIAVHAEARSFLHHQVRSMVGCLALVGQGKWTIDDMRNVLEARDRAQLGLNAPPDGLYFVGAEYPKWRFLATPGASPIRPVVTAARLRRAAP